MATLKSLMWAMVLLLMIIYVFGLAFTGEALDHSISGGVSWREPAVALQGISVLPTSLFTVYIAFVYFAVLNVTGVFCSSAVETTQRNPDLVAKSIIDNRRACTEKLQQLFGAIDDDASGLITIDELELISEDDLMKAYFQALQIDFRDAYTLFKLIDASNDGAIKLDDLQGFALFRQGCEKLKGNATSMEMAEISYDMRRLATQAMREDIAFFVAQVSAMLVALDSNGRCRNEMDDMLKPSAEKLLRAPAGGGGPRPTARSLAAMGGHRGGQGSSPRLLGGGHRGGQGSSPHLLGASGDGAAGPDSHPASQAAISWAAELQGPSGAGAAGSWPKARPQQPPSAAEPLHPAPELAAAHLEGPARGWAERLLRTRSRLLEEAEVLESVIASLTEDASAENALEHLAFIDWGWPGEGAGHARQISEGAEVLPTKQPTQPPDESADLPPQPAQGESTPAPEGDAENRTAKKKVTTQSRVTTQSSTTPLTASRSTEVGDVLGCAVAALKQQSGGSKKIDFTPLTSPALSKAPSRYDHHHQVLFNGKQVMSTTFEIFFGAVIGTNALVSGVEVQYRSSHIGEEIPDIFIIIRHTYTLLFLVELAMRVCTLGPRKFFTRGEACGLELTLDQLHLLQVIAIAEWRLHAFLAPLESNLHYCLAAGCYTKAEFRRLDGFQARCLRVIPKVPPAGRLRTAWIQAVLPDGIRLEAAASDKQQRRRSAKNF
ncbi:unnamed protein product [Prorocentrum cordatum]|uniref:Calmodulin n=1 Tax=Prorocentrum cordatum TaxID=2364126 RepID=A0ABN9RUM0_9DINO|nr:unnamed protein product [Polarella glacialis]